MEVFCCAVTSHLKVSMILYHFYVCRHSYGVTVADVALAVFCRSSKLGVQVRLNCLFSVHKNNRQHRRQSWRGWGSSHHCMHILCITAALHVKTSPGLSIAASELVGL